ncbi:MAG: polysaccharide deacetylase family protein [Planctomycetes bacterium]|nr:polysaccharide deacetylase family protein [Planctomycetota bacterium]
MSLANRIKPIVMSTAGQAASLLHATMGDRSGGAFGILMHHRVVPNQSNVSQPTWNVTPDRLREQLAGLIDRGYTPWPLRQVLSHAEAGQAIPRRVFVVTFDDGYTNNYQYAWPILRELGIPATIFLATGYIDSDKPFPFDDWDEKGKASVPASTWLPLTSAQCHEMYKDELIELGAHTHWHQDYTGFTDLFRQDSESCLCYLREALGIAEPTLSLPFGEHDQQLLDVARDTGFRCGLTTQPKLAETASDPFGWGRLAVFNHDTPGTLAAKLAGWYGPLATAWHRGSNLLSPPLGTVPSIVPLLGSSREAIQLVPETDNHPAPELDRYQPSGRY